MYESLFQSRKVLYNMYLMSSMQIILVLFMAATLAIVVIGVIAMAINGKLNKNHSNKLMRLRVLFQAIAILVFVIIVWLARN